VALQFRPKSLSFDLRQGEIGGARGLKLLQLQLHRKSGQAEALSQLETPEQVKNSVQRDQALIVRAEREKAQIAVARGHFELACDKAVFGFRFTLAIVGLLALLVVLIVNPELIPAALLSGGGLGAISALVRRRSHD
jgi:hypothetical protein